MLYASNTATVTAESVCIAFKLQASLMLAPGVLCTGKVPPRCLEQCMDKLKGGASSQNLHKCYSVSKNNKLHYFTWMQ